MKFGSTVPLLEPRGMELLRLDESHVEAAAHVIASAFSDDPYLTLYIPDQQQRVECSLHLWRFFTDQAVRFGESYAISENFEGIANWFAPDANVTGQEMSVSAHFEALLSSGGDKFLVALEHLSSMHDRNASMPHWYLQTIAIDPAHQGKGLATQLIRPMLSKIDAAGEPVYLETNTDHNIAFYEHYGFQVVEKANMPGLDGWNVSMLRMPGSG